MLNTTTHQTPVTDASRSDSEKFAAEYHDVASDNRYVYATNEQILEVFESGSGIVYLGFPECPWCQKFVPLIDTAAREEQLDKIYYFNIRTARSDNDDTYQKIVEHLKDYLQTDDDGNPRIYTPDITAIRDGEVVGRFKQEPSESGQNTPDTYWTDERKERAVTQLRELIRKTRD